jgi:hypothetical protein
VLAQQQQWEFSLGGHRKQGFLFAVENSGRELGTLIIRAPYPNWSATGVKPGWIQQTGTDTIRCGKGGVSQWFWQT